MTFTTLPQISPLWFYSVAVIVAVIDDDTKNPVYDPNTAASAESKQTYLRKTNSMQYAHIYLH